MITEEFKKYVETINKKEVQDPLSVKPSIWSYPSWDYIEPKTRDGLLLEFLKSTLKRARNNVPLYRQSKNYSNPNFLNEIEKCDTIEEALQHIPVLLKDSAKEGVGFRRFIRENPTVLKPDDIKVAIVYKSGGTKGVPTPTYITDWDLEVESFALARCFRYGGFEKGDIIYNFYNPTHKGGREIEDAAKKLGMTVMTRRPEENLEKCIELIKSYKTNAVAAVQPPLTETDVTKKGAGVTFLDIIGQDFRLFGKKNNDSIIKKAFITGYQIPQSIIDLAHDYEIDMFTTDGASELIPIATSNIEKAGICKYNNQHLILGPHYTFIAKIEDDTIVPVREGEDGIVLHTTPVREGTPYFNYAIGDKAKLITTKCECGRTTPVIGNIRRIDRPDEILGGCRYT